jgi:hypothetical protein
MILALDLSSHCGWAVGGPNGAPTFGVWELAKIENGDCGALIDSFYAALTNHVSFFKPSLIVYECDLSLHRQNPDTTALMQMGLVCATQHVGHCHGVKRLAQDAGTARKLVLGQYRFPKGTAKDYVLAWCGVMGYRTRDHNAGDALVLWNYAVATTKRIRLAQRAIDRDG